MHSRRQGVFPPIYVTSVLAGEKSGSLGEVLDRYITYQKLALAVRKKLVLSLVYPCLLIVLVVCLMVFLVTFVVPKFAELYQQHVGAIAGRYADPDRGGNHGSQLHPVRIPRPGAGGGRLPVSGPRPKRAKSAWTAGGCALPVVGEIWIKYQVAQFARVLGTLLVGGIPLLQALDTASSSLGTRLLKEHSGGSRPNGEGRPGAFGVAGQNQDLSGAFHRHDRGGRIHRRAAADAGQRG